MDTSRIIARSKIVFEYIIWIIKEIMVFQKIIKMFGFKKKDKNIDIDNKRIITCEFESRYKTSICDLFFPDIVSAGDKRSIIDPEKIDIVEEGLYKLSDIIGKDLLERSITVKMRIEYNKRELFISYILPDYGKADLIKIYLNAVINSLNTLFVSYLGYEKISITLKKSNGDIDLIKNSSVIAVNSGELLNNQSIYSVVPPEVLELIINKNQDKYNTVVDIFKLDYSEYYPDRRGFLIDNKISDVNTERALFYKLINHLPLSDLRLIIQNLIIPVYGVKGLVRLFYYDQEIIKEGKKTGRKTMLPVNIKKLFILLPERIKNDWNYYKRSLKMFSIDHFIDYNATVLLYLYNRYKKKSIILSEGFDKFYKDHIETDIYQGLRVRIDGFEKTGGGFARLFDLSENNRLIILNNIKTITVAIALLSVKRLKTEIQSIYPPKRLLIFKEDFEFVDKERVAGRIKDEDICNAMNTIEKKIKRFIRYNL